MKDEFCDIVTDTGGWTCRTCGTRWRTAEPPKDCAEDWPPVGRARAVFLIAAGLAIACVVTAAVFAARQLGGMP